MIRHWNDAAAPLQYLWDTTIFGGKALQTWADLFIWEKFLNVADAASLLELGTGEGFFSLWLNIQCLARDMAFTTVDINWPAAFVASPLDVSPLECFHRLDIFAETTKVEQLISEARHPLILSCDNGNKIGEFNTFVPMLSPGDFVVVHDWGSEIKPPDIAPLEHLFTNIPELADTLRQVQTFSLWLRRI